jgi:hypothetical protein
MQECERNQIVYSETLSGKEIGWWDTVSVLKSWNICCTGFISVVIIYVYVTIALHYLVKKGI